MYRIQRTFTWCAQNFSKRWGTRVIRKKLGLAEHLHHGRQCLPVSVPRSFQRGPASGRYFKVSPRRVSRKYPHLHMTGNKRYRAGSRRRRGYFRPGSTPELPAVKSRENRKTASHRACGSRKRPPVAPPGPPGPLVPLVPLAPLNPLAPRFP